MYASRTYFLFKASNVAYCCPPSWRPKPVWPGLLIVPRRQIDQPRGTATLLAIQRWVLDRKSLVMEPEEHKVHVGNLSYKTDEGALTQFFENKVQVDVADGKWYFEDDRWGHEKWSKAEGTSEWITVCFGRVWRKVLKFELTSCSFSLQETPRSCVLLKTRADWIVSLNVLNRSIGVSK